MLIGSFITSFWLFLNLIPCRVYRLIIIQYLVETRITIQFNGLTITKRIGLKSDALDIGFNSEI